MSEKCLICGLFISTDLVVVKKRGIERLITASKERNDGKDKYFYGKEEICFHRKCRLLYIESKAISAHKRRMEVEASVRQPSDDDESFDFQNFCLFCNEAANEEFKQAQLKRRVQDRIIVSEIKKCSTQEAILNAALLHTDDWSEQVERRIQGVDLKEKKAVYHGHCYAKFCHPYRATGGRRGKQQAPENAEAMNLIYQYLETNTEDCQFSIQDIRNAYPDVNLPTDPVIKYNLRKKYGDDILITAGNPSIICMLSNCSQMIQTSWYEARKENVVAEKQRIVEAAAKIILEEVTSRVYKTDFYPPPTAFLNDAEKDCPDSLLKLLRIIIMTNKNKDNESYERKCVALAHGIVSAARPRTFRSPVLLGLSSLIHHKYASRYLIDLFSGMGFCSTYDETLKFQVSAIATYTPKQSCPAFTQFVFDNADVNVHTIDGNNTFHTMGGIQCLNPPQTLSLNESIPRLNYIPQSFMKRYEQISLQTHIKTMNSGLDKVLFNPPMSNDDTFIMTKTDLLWMYGKSECFPDTPGFNSFMMLTQEDDVKNEQICEIRPVPFINAPASNYDTILTALKYAAEKCKQSDIDCIVTFDQPLYQKAQEIVKSSQDALISKIILRLGGFHLLMSFMGAIGKIMAGSGLREWWAKIYAIGSLEKMIMGHHYERAVRAHMLSSLALFRIIISNVEINLNEKIEMESALFKITDGDQNKEMNNEILQSVLDKFVKSLQELEGRGPTSMLWVAYFKMTLLIQNFIKAERIGDWNLHIKCVKEMLPYFHAAGHFNYAKSASLYAQEMDNLEAVMTPECYKRFISEKMFTVRRTQKPCSGTWSDMTIEQTLMRSMKVSGGLTQGRGFSDNVLSKWILGLPILHSITEEVENFCDTSVKIHNHKDGSSSRMSRDAKDLEHLSQWLNEHNPFPNTTDIISISTGVVGNEKINPHKAVEIGKNIMNDRKGTSFAQIKYSRKETVQPLGNVNLSISVEEKKVSIEPDLIFKRISFLKKSQDELKTYLQYELSPYPLSLFDKNGMRKTNKSIFYEMFSPVTPNSTDQDQLCDDVNLKDEAHVIDGGLLLHRVVWQKNTTYSAICKKYVDYVKKFTNPTVVFDGYENENCVKNQERKRRAKGRMNTCVVIQENSEATMTQDQFLSNDQNKSRLITMLTLRLKSENIPVFQSKDDADTLIISTAIEIADTKRYRKVMVVGEDIDLLVLLTSKKRPDIVLMKPGKGKITTKLYNADSFKADPDIVLLSHAFTGCDTTSAIFRQGKRKVCTKMMKNSLKQAVNAFNDPCSSHEEISKAGEIIFCELYGGNKTTDINILRYERFAQSLTKSSTDLATLPPTSSAAKQHSLRVYYQIQKWLGNELNPTDCGWEKQASGMAPITTTENPAPDEILKIISCKCKLECKGTCTCIKAGLKCTALCIHCTDKKCCGDVDITETAFDVETEVHMNNVINDTICDNKVHEKIDTELDTFKENVAPNSVDYINVPSGSVAIRESAKRQRLS
ncbi:uncharacterized protein LOC133530150 [Cydia pomonella]|uniref:uncharacterized protein LOC133530150 n=1 Tax=Cydia pomonella TaxID=82600 RepID=UPI002ADDBC87|nr:uncharacterized protein LOC133530150 [Cydia pomonella]